MRRPTPPPNETDRLRALERYELLDTAPEERFDALARLAARGLRVPVALVTLVDGERQWFKARYGLDVPETPRDVSFCGHVVSDGVALVVFDALEDPRFADNPLVLGAPHVRAYAGVPLRARDGEVLGTLCAIDRSPRRFDEGDLETLRTLAAQLEELFEARLQRLEVRRLDTFRAFFSLSPVLLFAASIDEASGLRDWNPAWGNALGWSLDALRAGPPLGKVFAPDRARCAQALAAAIAAPGCPQQVECRMVHADGGLVPVAWTVARVGDALVGVGVDYSRTASELAARESAERELRASEERYRSLVHSLDAIVWEGDSTSLAFTYVSPQAERLTGHPVEAWYRPRFWVEHLHPDEASAVVEQCQRTTAAGEDHVLEYRFRAADGSWRWLRDIVAVDRSSGTTKIHGLLTDITHARRVEEELREASKLEAVGRLAAGVAHDFNNMLMAISAISEALGASARDEAQRARVGELLAVSQRATGLVRQLLAFGRQQRLAPRPVRLQDVVHEALPVLRAVLGGERPVEVLVEGAPAPVLVDPMELHRVLLNLALNARDAMPGGGRVRVALREEGAQVALCVRDDGQGMTEEVRARCFEPFFTTKPVGAGSGMGLASVHGVVSQSGGTVALESAPGRGTAVTLRFPRAEAGAVGPVAAPVPATEPSGACSVLLVDDDGLLRRALSNGLARYGFRVRAFEHGAAALSVLAQPGEGVDVLLSDLMMPGLSGLELAREARRLRPSLPVVLLSGYCDESVSEEAARAQLPLLQKPVDLALLARALAGAAQPAA